MKKWLYLIGLITILIVLNYFNVGEYHMLNEPFFELGMRVDLLGLNEGDSLVPVSDSSSESDVYFFTLEETTIERLGADRLLNFSLNDSEEEEDEDPFEVNFYHQYVAAVNDEGICETLIPWDKSYGTVQTAEIANSGEIYLHSVIFNTYNTFIQEESIYLYKPEEKALSKVITWNYEKIANDKKPYITGNIRNLQTDGDVTGFYYFQDSKVIFFRCEGTKVVNDFKIEVPENTELDQIMGITPEKILATNTQSDLMVAENGRLKVVKNYIDVRETTIRKVFAYEDDYLVWLDDNTLEHGYYVDEKLKIERLDYEADARISSILPMGAQKYLIFVTGGICDLLTISNDEFFISKNTFSDFGSIKSVVKMKGNKVFLSTDEGSGMSKGYTLELHEDEVSISNVELKKDEWRPSLYFFKLDNEYMLFRALRIGMMVLSLIVFVYLIRYIYIYFMQKRMPMTLKLLMVTVPVLTLVLYIVIQTIVVEEYEALSDDIKGNTYYQFSNIIDYQLDRIKKENRNGDPDYLVNFLENVDITNDEYIQSEEYRYFEEFVDIAHLEVLKEDESKEVFYDSIEEGLEGFYIVFDVVKDNQAYKLHDTNYSFKYFLQRHKATHAKAANGEVSQGLSKNYLYRMEPIFNDEGEVVGIIQAGINFGGYKNYLDDKLFSSIMKTIGLIPIIVVPLIGIIAYIMLRRLGVFTRKVQGITTDNLDVEVIIKSNDEINTLSVVFNNLAKNLNDYIKNVTHLSKSYHRFVPQEIFKLLNKDEVTDVALGDNEERVMTILCAGIDNFYEITENLSSEESLKLINAHLKVISSIIKKNKGIIENYNGVGVVAIFPEETDYAVSAAIDIQKAIQKHKGTDYDLRPVNVAIHHGKALLGIIGEGERLQSSVISDKLSEAMLLQSKASVLASRILVTKDAFDQLEKSYKYRNIGNIKPAGRSESVEVIDIFDGDESYIISKKESYNAHFSAGVEAFNKGDYIEARIKFVHVLEKNIDDAVARLYFYESDKRLRKTGKYENDLLV